MVRSGCKVRFDYQETKVETNAGMSIGIIIYHIICTRNFLSFVSHKQIDVFLKETGYPRDVEHCQRIYYSCCQLVLIRN